ncbi:MAG TPA: hypothetical protein VNQ73_02615 [Ilumatobacter sp.]|nr:hypothetical protein [Ilumatobacter sp.]
MRHLAHDQQPTPAPPVLHVVATAPPFDVASLPVPVIDWHAVYAVLADWERADQPTGEQIARVIAAHEATCPHHVLVAGTPAAGFELTGPVDPNDPDVIDFIRDHVDTEWWFVPVAAFPDGVTGGRP